MAILFRNKTPEAENFPADDGTDPIHNLIGEEIGRVPRQKPKKSFWEFLKLKKNPEETIIYGSSLPQEKTDTAPVDSNVAEVPIVEEAVQAKAPTQQKHQKKRLREKAEKKRLQEEQPLLDHRPSRKAASSQEKTHVTAPEFKSEEPVLEFTPEEEAHLGNIVAEEFAAMGLQSAVHNPEISTDAKLGLSNPGAHAEITERVKNKLFFKRPSVHSMVEFFGGMAMGATYKTLAAGVLKKAIRYAGAGSSFGTSFLVGAAVGASWEVGKTYLQERRRVKREKSDYKQELENLLGTDRLEELFRVRGKEDAEVLGLDDLSKEILEKHDSVKISGKKFGRALFKGALIGGAGGVIGSYIAEQFIDPTTVASTTAEHGQAIHETAKAVKDAAKQSFEVVRTDVTQETHKTVWNTVKQWYIDHGVPKENINNKLVERGVERVAGLDNIEITGHHGAPDFSGFQHTHFDEGMAGAVKDIHMHEGDLLHHMESLNDIIKEAGGNAENLNVTVNYPTGLPGVPVPHVDMHETEGLGYNTWRNVAIGTLAFGGAAYGLLRRRKKQPEQAAENLQQTVVQPEEIISDEDIINPMQSRHAVEEPVTAPEYVVDVAPATEQTRAGWYRYMDEALNPWGNLIDDAEDALNEGRLDQCGELLNKESEAWEELNHRSGEAKGTEFAGDINEIYGPVVFELDERARDLRRRLQEQSQEVPELENLVTSESSEKQQRVEREVEMLTQIFQGANNMVLDAEEAFAEGHIDLASRLLNQAWKIILQKDEIPPDLEVDIEPMYSKLRHEFKERANALEQQIHNPPTILPQVATIEQSVPQDLIEPAPVEKSDDEVVPAPVMVPSPEANKDEVLQEKIYNELEEKFESWEQYLANSFEQKLKAVHDANDYEGYESVIEEQQSFGGALALWESEEWMEQFGTEANKAQELAEQWDQVNEERIGRLVDKAFNIKNDFKKWYEARPRVDIEVQSSPVVVHEEKSEEKELDKVEDENDRDALRLTFEILEDSLPGLDIPSQKDSVTKDIIKTVEQTGILLKDPEIKAELRLAYEQKIDALVEKLLEQGHEDVARQVWGKGREGEFPSISKNDGEKVEQSPEESVHVESAPQAQTTTEETKRLVEKTKEQERGEAVERITRAAIESGINLKDVSGKKYGELLLPKEYGGQLWKAKLSEGVVLDIQKLLREVKDWENISDFDRESLKQIFTKLGAPKYKSPGIKRVAGELAAMHPVLKELEKAAKKINKLK